MLEAFLAEGAISIMSIAAASLFVWERLQDNPVENRARAVLKAMERAVQRSDAQPCPEGQPPGGAGVDPPHLAQAAEGGAGHKDGGHRGDLPRAASNAIRTNSSSGPLPAAGHHPRITAGLGGRNHRESGRTS
jgi:hypothetical protein